jgi:hypothetical protein
MMQYGYGFGGFSFFGGFMSLVVLVDLILLGVWLWQKIGKE